MNDAKEANQEKVLTQDTEADNRDLKPIVEEYVKVLKQVEKSLVGGSTLSINLFNGYIDKTFVLRGWKSTVVHVGMVSAVTAIETFKIVSYVWTIGCAVVYFTTGNLRMLE